MITIDTLRLKCIERNNPILDTKVFLELVNWSVKTNDFFEDVLKDYKPHICGCLGPQNGFSECPCSLSSLASKYKYEIAIYILANDIEIVDKSEERRLANEEFTRKMQEIFGERKQGNENDD